MDYSDCFPQGSAVSSDSESERRGKQGGYWLLVPPINGQRHIKT